MSRLKQLADLGQAVWLDYIRRDFVASGELAALIERGLKGVTSNPTIFEKAITGSADYDGQLREFLGLDRRVEEIYEALALQDIGAAADALRPVYEAGGGGFVSIEVSPELAADTEGTVAAGRRLFESLGRPNVMIKVPATPAGLPAIRAMIAAGVNVNATLIFSRGHYEAAAEAYMAGLEDLVSAGGDPSRVASVASFFVSRLDTALDAVLEARGAAELAGRIAVANARVTYARFRELLRSPRWQRLAAAGARVQRLLWASTGTKNSRYPDTLYVDELVGPDTVNTLPPATLKAFEDHGRAAPGVTRDPAEAREELARLEDLGIDLEAVTEKLQEEGVAAFAASFRSLLEGIAAKLEALGREGLPAAVLGEYREAVERGLAAVEAEDVVTRIWARDHTVWKPGPAEIANRLGWLRIAGDMQAAVPGLLAFAASVREAGCDRVLLLGMGGSSLAPELFANAFGARPGCPGLQVLDSTDPGAVLDAAADLDPARTLFVVSTKSGGTVETLSFLKFFYNRVRDELGEREAGRRFVAVTDPGSSLEALARELGFRRVFLNDPNIGGRYSALSCFGLLPAALLGVDANLLLERALEAGARCAAGPGRRAADNPGALMGVVMAELAKAGRDKLTFLLSPRLASFGDWVEQLIAESTGKEGRGIVPVVGEEAGNPEVYGADRLFVVMRLEGDDGPEEAAARLEAAGFPLLRLTLKDVYDIGAQFFLWELATAVAGQRLGINPFDQPDVESAKRLAREMTAEFLRSGSLPEDRAVAASPGALGDFLRQARTGDYIALQAYLQPGAETLAALQALRVRLRDRTRLAVTVGIGPRFLHSTGQLHKGDGGRGLFVQLTAPDSRDAPIPERAGGADSGLGFAALKLAQSLGDGQALLAAGRRVIRLRLEGKPPEALKRLASAL